MLTISSQQIKQLLKVQRLMDISRDSSYEVRWYNFCSGVLKASYANAIRVTLMVKIENSARCNARKVNLWNPLFNHEVNYNLALVQPALRGVALN